MKKRLLLSLSFAVCIATSVLGQTPPTTQWSANTDISWYNQEDTQFEINTSAQFAGLAELVNGGTDFLDKTIILTANIDLDAHLWTPIGSGIDFPFSGTFNGNNFTISNLFIVIPGGDFIGLFGQCFGATVENVFLENTYIRSHDTVGSIAGNFSTNSTITNCHATGVDIVAEAYNIGGLVGGLLTNSSMHRCSSQGSVTGINQVGGLVGSPWDLANITESYSAGSVSAEYLAGGLIGYSTFAFGPDRDITIQNCYSRANVSVTTGRVGGLVGGTDGSLFIYNSYATGTATGPEFVGGFIGAVGSVTLGDVYWDVESSGLEQGVGGFMGPPSAVLPSGKTTAEMKSDAMVDSLNLNQEAGPWTIVPGQNDGYPVLVGMPTAVQTIEATDFKISVYPTLVTNQVTIQSEKELVSYTLFDLTGKILDQKSLDGNTSRVNVQLLPSGVYILTVKTTVGIASQKLVKQ